MSDIERVESRAGLERRPWSRLDLTPAERVARRRNRRWMLVIVVPSIIVLAVALMASGRAEHNEPSGPHLSAPAGYKVQNDGYFSYAVPSQWSNDPANTDSTGDVDTAGRSGFAAEHIGYRTGPPVLGEAPPASLRAFGAPQPQPYRLTGGHPVSVKGAAVAFSYTMTRPGFSATVIDAWTTKTYVEMWLVVHAPADVTNQILATLAT